jgi:cytochrome c peroxidase
MRVVILLCGCLGLLSVSRLIGPPSYSAGVQAAVEYFKTQSGAFAASCSQLSQAAIELADNPQKPRDRARRELAACRCRYKYIESFLEYFFRSSSTIYNRAPKFETEDGSMEYQSPVGLQVIESMLCDSVINKQALLQQVNAVESAAADLPALLYGLRADDRQELESLRVELIRIMALDITGYEAPLLKSGITEGHAALESFAYQLQPYLTPGEKRSDSLCVCLNNTIARLSQEDFDGFDRLHFMREAMLPLQKQLSLLIRERRLELNTTKTLNYSADNLFAPDALSPDGFPGDSRTAPQPDERARKTRAYGPAGGSTRSDAAAMLRLGRTLFSETRLSGNGTKSCASCHDPSKAFTDRLPVSVGFDGHQQLDRNAPTLLYSAYQFSQFWDGRVKTLEEQIRTVMADAREMRGDTTGLLGRLRQDRFYDSSFAEAFPKGGVDVAKAIAAYVRSLHPMNSPFDRYIRGEALNLSPDAIKGANLFMGKAQCATCHFMPLFNGLIPPDYALSEFEVLGTPADDQFADSSRSSLHLSKDEGRYKLFPFPFLKGAFKTPTVRDAELTGPYMHNGAFRSLETVMTFYNNGGGAGMGLDVPDQTLSSTHLNLSVEEIKDIILFIHVLTDSIPTRS